MDMRFLDYLSTTHCSSSCTFTSVLRAVAEPLLSWLPESCPPKAHREMQGPKTLADIRKHLSNHPQAPIVKVSPSFSLLPSESYLFSWALKDGIFTIQILYTSIPHPKQCATRKEYLWYPLSPSDFTKIYCSGSAGRNSQSGLHIQGLPCLEWVSSFY